MVSIKTTLDRKKVSAQGKARENNFGIIRLAAAVFVFAGHMGVILGTNTPLLGTFPLHEIGVFTLFLVSGYLITKSWLSDPDPLRFAVRRFLRLWPPFAVFVLLMAFVAGPLLSDLGVNGYFESGYQTYLRNLRFFVIYRQPGVFVGQPADNTTNGSLWTMPVEAFLYIVTPLLLTFFRVKRKTERSFLPVAVFTGAAIGLDIYLRAFCAGKTAVLYGVDVTAAYHLIVMYVIGMLFTYKQMRKLLNLQIGCMAMCLALLIQMSAGPLQYLTLYLVFPYFILSFVFAPKPAFAWLDRKPELSYGIYLYGFFFQQLIVWMQYRHGWSLTYGRAFLLSAVPTILAAVLSYYLVEKPSQKLSRYLVKKLKSFKL